MSRHDAKLPYETLLVHARIVRKQYRLHTQDAADILHDVLIKADFKCPSLAYLKTAITNRAIDVWRHEQVELEYRDASGYLTLERLNRIRRRKL